MIFRYGGLFILCVVGASILSDVRPFSTLGVGTGLAVTAVTYLILLKITSILARSGKQTSCSSPSYPHWPKSRPNRRTELIAGFVWLSVPTFIFFRTSDITTALCSLMMLAVGWSVVNYPVSAIKYGYFPDSPRGKGVGRDTEPGQFWATVAVFFAIGAPILCAPILFAIAKMLSW